MRGAWIAALLLATPVAAQSTLKFDMLEQDAGHLYQHETRVVEFPFVVEGDTQIRLFRDPKAEDGDFHTNCGCTGAYVRPDWLAVDGDLSTVKNQRWDLSLPIPPGARGTVVTTLTGKGFTLNKDSTVTLRGTMENKTIVLTVHAQIESIFEIRPAPIGFGEVQLAAVRAGSVTTEATVRCDKAFEVSEWYALPDGLKVEEIGDPVLEEGGEVTRRFRFTLGKELPVGVWNRQASAKTSIGVDLDVVFSATVQAPVAFDPSSRISLGFPRAGQIIQRTVKVDLKAEGLVLPQPTAVLAGTVAAQLEVEVVAREAGKAYDVIVRTREGSEPGKYSGKLQITFPEGSGYAGHEMPVTIRIRKQA